MAAHLLEGVSTQGTENRDAIERHERLVALGSLTAGLTHELNNPVAAVLRASARLREMLAEMREKLGLLVRSQLPGDKLEAVADLAARALASSRAAAPPVADRGVRPRGRARRLAEDHGIADAWEIAPTLVAAGLGIDWLEELVEMTPPPNLDYGLSYPVRAVETDHLLDEITDGVDRISGLLAVGQAVHPDGPGAAADVRRPRGPRRHPDDAQAQARRRHQGRPRVRPQPPADPRLPRRAQPGVDQPHRQRHRRDGRAAARSRCAPEPTDEQLVVEIADTGPGVPDEIRSRVFEPFFTTKDIGKGTGLGLDIAWRIVVGRHGGEIRLDSEPGDTRFVVVLPPRPPNSRTLTSAATRYCLANG